MSVITLLLLILLLLLFFARSLDCFLLPFREIQILCFYRKSNKLHVQTCLGDYHLRGGLLLPVSELLPSSPYGYTVWKKLYQSFVHTEMDSSALRPSLHRQRWCLFMCFRLLPWVNSVPLCLLSISDQLENNNHKKINQILNFQPEHQSNLTKLPVLLRVCSKNGEEGGGGHEMGRWRSSTQVVVSWNISDLRGKNCF